MASRLCPLTVGLLVSTHSCTVPPLYTQIVRQQQVPAELLYAVASSESGTHMYPVAVSVPLPQCEHWLQTAPLPPKETIRYYMMAWSYTKVASRHRDTTDRGIRWFFHSRWQNPTGGAADCPIYSP